MTATEERVSAEPPDEVAAEGQPATPREERGVPRVSVGMPVYNGEEYLERALDSLLAQEFDDFELIISDNGSTDRTEEICRRYAERDPRIRYHRVEENQGASWNFNRAFELARGEYFRWACHDDTVEPTHLKRCVEVLDNAPPSVVLAYSRTILVNEEDVPVWTSDENLDTEGMPPHERLRAIAKHLRYSNCLYGLVRRDVMERTSLIGPYESSDYVLIVQLGLLGEFVEIPAYLFRRRIHSGMSRQANRSAQSVAEWFAASRARVPKLAQIRLLREYARAVFQAPMGPIERVRSTFALWYWFRRGARPLAKELWAMVAPGYNAYR